MAREKIQYRCDDCGRLEPKWLGLCPGCGQWNSLHQFTVEKTKQLPATNRQVSMLATDIVSGFEERSSVGSDELDRVLGGGLIQGQVILLGGEPGIGKSTLLLQVCANLSTARKPVLYVSAEESARQIKVRAERLELNLDGLHILNGTNCMAAIDSMTEKDFSLVVIDSIQTMRCPDLTSAPGSVSQVRESAARLADHAKANHRALCLIGHVTKEGTLAGPRTLEHLVDTVLYFEADSGRSLRVVRAHKNRHGPVSEIGVFEMTQNGLQEVPNPSATFLADRPAKAPGSVVLAMLRGSRPVLVEVQALVGPSGSAQPRRTAWGCDPNRAALLAAVLERRAGLQLAGCDLFLNVAGGLAINEPAADLAICAAIASSFLDRPLPPQMAVFGEIGLAGEIRTVPAAPTRCAEAFQLGFDCLLLPSGNLAQMEATETPMDLRGLSTVEQLVEQAIN
jgi:DNA repair protein RadA/Sms